MNRHAAVFLDRDGVLNRAYVRNGTPHPPTTLDELVVDDKTVAAVRRLRAHGFLVVCVTNQPDVVRGHTTRERVEEINESVRRRLSLDDLRCCFHDTPDDCACRKPRPGMLLDAAATAGIDLGRSYMVGDRWTDVDAGRRAGCLTVLLGSGYGEAGEIEPDRRANGLTAAVGWIVQRTSDAPDRS